MELFFRGHDYKYAVEQILLTLFPEERPVYPAAPTGADSASVSLHCGARFVTAATVLRIGGQRCAGQARVERSALDGGAVVSERLRQRIIKQSFYRAGVRCLGKKPVWGALSGIRPAKLLRNLLDAEPDEQRACRRFMEIYDVSPERTALTLDAARCAAAVQTALAPRDVCLYLGVPFCPTRCAYCSFVSQSVERSLALIDPFVQALERDISATAAAARENGLRVIAVYFGGGTPTTLTAEQLDRVIDRMQREFDLSACREFTVEAGRPDTITPEKLDVLVRRGVTRISVNPQTMRDEVLRAIGRRHTAEDVRRALELVRAAGPLQVNMDLIAGLPEDTPAGFAQTLTEVLALGAENITVHTLALKKGSRIMLEGTRLPGAAEVGEMLDMAQSALRGRGYAPYYLYRQKFMSGGFENVGWCLPGTENLYNICIMEELCSIFAMGAGGSTKLVRGDGRLSRFFAPKYPQEYISGIEKVCADKEQITRFYQGGTL